MTSEKRKLIGDATNMSWQHFWKSPHEGLVIFQGRVDDAVIIYADMNVHGDERPLRGLHMNHFQPCQSQTKAVKPSYSSNTKDKTPLLTLSQKVERILILTTKVAIQCLGMTFSSSAIKHTK